MGLLARLIDPEQRSYPPQWLNDWFVDRWGGKLVSGVSVTTESALKYAAFYSAVDLISRSVASLPLILYQRQGDDDRKRAPAHPLYDILHRRPNSEQTAFMFWQAMQGWTLTWGNAYAEIVRDRAGRVVDLWPIRPDMMKVGRDAQKNLVYEQLNDRGQVQARFGANQILHGKTFGDGIIGKSPVALFREAIGLGLATEKYGAAFFGNDARPGGVIEHPMKLSPNAARHLMDSWRARHAGPDNAHSPTILEEGMKWTSIGLPNDDAQFLETRNFGVIEIARIFHVPPHKLAELTRATFSNIEMQSIEYVQDCLAPWLVNWEQEISSKLLTDAERKQFYPEFAVEGMLRADTASRYTSYGQAIRDGWMSRNEVRKKENLNAVEGLDEYLQPTNMAPAGYVPSGANTPAPGPAPDSEHDDDQAGAARQRMLADLCRRIVRREAGALSKAGDARNLPSEWWTGHADYLRDVLTPSVWGMLAVGGDGVNADTVIALFAAKYIASRRLSLAKADNLAVALADWQRRGPEHMARELLGVMDNATSRYQAARP